jgi:DNA-binding MarR family transcriptional regulator
MGGAGRRRDVVEEDVLEAGRLVGRAALIYHAKVGAVLGLGPTDMKALDILESLGPTSPSDLAQRLQFAPASVTGLLDRLESRDLVRRVRHPEDGRRVLVELNAEAVERLRPIYAPLSDALRTMMGKYSVAELSLIARALHDMAEHQMRAAEQIDDSDVTGARPRRNR